MPKVEPKAILSRVVLGKSRQKGDDLDYLCTGLQRYYLLASGSHAIGRATDNHDDDDDDDRISTRSFSTTATADNLPGTGRAVDTYIYQPAGRWIERVAMRFTIASLHPARIAQYLEEDDTRFHPVSDEPIKLHDIIAQVSYLQRNLSTTEMKGFCFHHRNGSTVVAGMKGLVKQTQSNSIDRSACALAALIRVSLVYMRTEIYANVSRIEPIFHLETLVRSHPDKKWFLLLVNLARVILIAGRKPSTQKSFDPVLRKEAEQLWPSLESAQKLRQRLIRVLEIYRISSLDSLEDTIGKSCAICAEAVSTYIDMDARGDEYKHILETVYFTVVFIMRSIHELTDFASITANRHIYMILQTIVYCIDAIVYRCLHACKSYDFDMDLLKANIAFRSLFVDGDTLLPGSFKYSSDTRVLDMRTLPRRHRSKGTAPIQSLFEAANHRTLRLLRSFNELEREVWGCASRINISTSQFEIDADRCRSTFDNLGDEWWDYSMSTLRRARRVQVPETILTNEFRNARMMGLSSNRPFMSWNLYESHRVLRRRWGQYLRSNMDWDWDLATCMECLFKLEKHIRGGPSRTAPASSTAIDMAARPRGALKISMRDAQEESLPTEVQFEYKTKTGETRYMSFVPAGSGPGYQPNSVTASAGLSAEQILDPADAQQISGNRKGSFGGELEVENPETDACEDTPVKGSNDGFEWKGPEYDGGYDEGRAGEETISICSLD